MSLNLIYVIKHNGRKLYEDFEWQTSSDFTIKVCNAETKEEQIQLIVDRMDELSKLDDGWDSELKAERLESIKANLKDKDTKLSMM